MYINNKLILVRSKYNPISNLKKFIELLTFLVAISCFTKLFQLNLVSLNKNSLLILTGLLFIGYLLDFSAKNFLETFLITVTALSVFITVRMMLDLGTALSWSSFSITLSLVFLAISLIIKFFLKPKQSPKDQSVYNLIIAVIFLYFYKYYVNFNESKALSILVKNGEDNASWLQGAAENYLALTNNSNLIWNPDPPIGLLQNLITLCLDSSNILSKGIQAAPLVVLSTQGLILGIFLSLLTIYALKNFEAHSKCQIILFALTGLHLLSSFLIFQNYLILGHTTALFVVGGLSVAILGTGFFLNSKLEVVQAIIFITLFMGGTFAWSPLRPVGLVLIIVIIFLIFIRLRFFISKRSFLVIGTVSTTALATICLMSLVKFAESSKISTLLELLHLPGGNANWPSLFFLISVLLAYLKLRSLINENNIESLLIKITILGLTSYLGLLFTLSSLTEPYEVGYGSRKFFGIFTSIMIIAIMPQLASFLKESKMFLQNLIPVYVGVLVLILTEIPSLSLGYNSLISRQPSLSWVEIFFQEKDLYPERNVVCLNTDESPNPNSYDVYVCNRFLVAMQLSSNPQIARWTLTDLKDSFEDVPKLNLSEDFYKNLTIIRTNKNRTSTENTSQKVFLDEVRYDLVRLR